MTSNTMNAFVNKIGPPLVSELGHCPMRFVDGHHSENNDTKTSPCKCNDDYNHCIANNDLENNVPEVSSSDDLFNLFVPDENEEGNETDVFTTTTMPPEVKLAMGFDELTDEIAIATQAQQNLMFAVGEKPLHEKIALSHSKEELMLKCSFNQRDCDFERDFKLHHDPTYGNCYTFNWNRTQPVSVHRAGANYGLRILLYSNRSEYLPTSEAVGFRITVHDQWSHPFPDAFGYSAPTGFMSSFGVRMKTFHRIPPPYGQCLEGGEESEFYIYKGFNYSLEGCHRSCTQNEIVRVCGCSDPSYPIPNNTTRSCSVNNPQSRDCIKRVTQYINVAMNEGRLANCSCHQPCSNIAYEVYFSGAGWPSGTTKILECEPHDELCMEKYRKNAALIQVFYEELNQEALSESPAYTWMSLLADFGGLTGLWIGASVVSLFEIVILHNQYLDKMRSISMKLIKYEFRDIDIAVLSYMMFSQECEKQSLFNDEIEIHKRLLFDEYLKNISNTYGAENSGVKFANVLSLLNDITELQLLLYEFRIIGKVFTTEFVDIWDELLLLDNNESIPMDNSVSQEQYADSEC
uniref:Uncharacterized protein n=1 Tax=Acrobeloides nanus TaxID=290746 RepID=A0A914DVI9_9BILA